MKRFWIAANVLLWGSCLVLAAGILLTTCRRLNGDWID